MTAAGWLCALAWGAFCGFIVAAMDGIWWQLPYWGVAMLVLGLASWVALIREECR